MWESHKIWKHHHSTLKLLSNVKIKWEIFFKFLWPSQICELYAIRERMLEKQKKCPKGKVSLHLNRKLFRRLPLDFHGKITLIDSPSTSVLVRYTQYPIMYVHKNWSIKWSVHYMDLNFCPMKFTFEKIIWQIWTNSYTQQIKNLFKNMKLAPRRLYYSDL